MQFTLRVGRVVTLYVEIPILLTSQDDRFSIGVIGSKLLT